MPESDSQRGVIIAADVLKKRFEDEGLVGAYFISPKRWNNCLDIHDVSTPTTKVPQPTWS